MAISEELLIIIIVAALAVALVITIIMAVYFCYYRRRALTQQRQQQQQPSSHNPHTSTNQTHHHVLPRNDVSTGGGGKMRLDKLPTAAQTKRMEEGHTFTGESHMNGNGGNTQSDDTYNFIMGPSADQSEQGGVENDGFAKDNQLESAAYLRGGVDPADVAEIYMQDDVLQEAAHARRKQQLEVRRKASKNNSKKRATAQKNLQEVRKSSGEAHQGRDKDRERDSSRHGHKSSEKHRQPRT